jgi:hypothetical protein
MIAHTDATYGPTARNRLAEASEPTPAGARSALETFYFALHHSELNAMRAVWADDPFAQLNNPLGGILRGGRDAVSLYERVFASNIRLEVTFGDIIEYPGIDHVVFAGREIGHYTIADAQPIALAIRTSRYFRYARGRWTQYHHHGSIDDPDMLAAYQAAVTA